MRDDANDQGVQIQTANKVSRPKLDRRNILLAGTTLAAASAIASGTRVQVAQGQPQPSVSSGQRPNILIIMGDDIGIPQISAYSMGMMGYRTPNIDRIAREGAIFTDSYGQQSCTAGRASFILGQEPFRAGLLTIGMPGDPHGIADWMPTIADDLNAEEEPEGYFYPKDPEFKKKYGPRGVIHSWANADGTQKIEDTGPLNHQTNANNRRGIPWCSQEVH